MRKLRLLSTLLAFTMSVYAFDFARESSFQNACDKGDAQACLDLGIMYHLGDGVSQNFKHARSLYEQACKMGLGEGCETLGYMYENGHAGTNYAKASELYLKGCELGRASACASLAKLYENGTGVEEDMQQAVDFYDKACDGGDGRSCAHLGLLYDQDDNDTYAAMYYQKACDAKDADACSTLGIMYMNGKGVNTNAQKAYELFQQACKLGNEIGCKNYESMKNSSWY